MDDLRTKVFQCELCTAYMRGNVTKSHQLAAHPDITFDDLGFKLMTIPPKTRRLFEKSKLSDQVPTMASLSNVSMTHVDCRLCNNRMPANALRSHMERKHNDVATPDMIFKQPMVIDKGPKTLRELCKFCGTLIEREFMDAHVRRKHKEHVNTSINESMEMDDAGNEGDGDGDGVVTCKFCNHPMPRKSLARHMQRKHSTEPRSNGNQTTGNENEASKTEQDGFGGSSKCSQVVCEGSPKMAKLDGDADKSDQVKCEFCTNAMPSVALERHVKRKHADKIDADVSDGRTPKIQSGQLVAVYFDATVVERKIQETAIYEENGRFYASGRTLDDGI